MAWEKSLEALDFSRGSSHFIYVLYMQSQRAARYEVSYNTQLGQWERDGKRMPDGTYNFVITRDWKMLACSDEDEQEFNSIIKEKNLSSKVFFKHTTLTRREAVYFGGMGRLEKGRYTWNGQSGYYRPQAVQVALCGNWLKSHGITDSFYIKSEKEKKREKRILV
jgi:hypothetical protein